MSLKLLRERAFLLQRGRCYYCGARMWLHSPSELGLSRASSRHSQCTAEHLVARCDGGRGTHDNIVAACRYCNKRRHARKVALAPAAFMAYVRKRVARSAWNVAFALF